MEGKEMAKRLFRLVTRVLGFNKTSSRKDSTPLDYPPKKEPVSTERHSPPQHLDSETATSTSAIGAKLSDTPLARDAATGQAIEAEVLDPNKVTELSKDHDRTPSQTDIIRQRARDDAYVKAIRGLLALNLDPDILTDALESLRVKYYGKAPPPEEVITIVSKIIKSS